MTPSNPQRPTSSLIDLGNLVFNFHSVRRFVGTGPKYLAVVKADAYGHGAVECSRRLAAEGIDWFGVALPEEGIELRMAGVREPILVLGGFWPGQQDAVIKHKLVPVVFTVEQASLLDAAAATFGVVSDFHVKIDTGMGRIGVPADQSADFAAALLAFKNIRLDGMMTHFAAADDLGQSEFTRSQIGRFDASAKVFRDLGFDPTFVDLANSPGAIAYPESRRNLVRLGGVLFGLGGDVLPKGVAKPELRPVLSFSSQIGYVKLVRAGATLGYGRTFVTKRDSVVASIPVGYGDGFPRSLSNIGRVIVRDKFAAILGRISMDWTIIDVSDIPGVSVGDDVTLIGGSEGLKIKAEDLAAETGTISYEITCGIDSRVPRRFVG